MKPIFKTVENVGGADAEFVIFEISPLPAK